MEHLFILFSLHTELADFGLNPTEWRLKKIGHNLFQISHVTDSDFKLVGKVQTKKNRTSWSSVKLWSF